MNPKEAITIATLAGEIMLSNGAETYRVEDTMRRILNSFNYEAAESFVTPTGIIASIDDNENSVVSIVKRVRFRTTNLEKVALVNQFSRDLSNNAININEAYNILKEIETKPTYEYKFRVLASGMCCFSFSFMLGGNLYDCLASLLIGFIAFIINYFFKTRKVSNMIVNLLMGICISLTALIVINLGLGNNFDTIIISSMMPYFPGVLLTNAIKDIFEEDFLSGLTRITDAILVSVSLATGVGTVLKLWLFILGGIRL